MSIIFNDDGEVKEAYQYVLSEHTSIWSVKKGKYFIQFDKLLEMLEERYETYTNAKENTKKIPDYVPGIEFVEQCWKDYEEMVFVISELIVHSCYACLMRSDLLISNERMVTILQCIEAMKGYFVMDNTQRPCVSMNERTPIENMFSKIIGTIKTQNK